MKKIRMKMICVRRSRKRGCSHSKCNIIVLTMLFVGLFVMAIGCSGGGHRPQSTSSAEQLYATAQEYDRQGMFTQARSFYMQAKAACIVEGNPSLALLCRNAMQRITLYEATYPYTEEQLRQLIVTQIPSASTARIDGWFANGSLEHVTLNGVTRYLDAIIIGNIKYRNVDLFRADTAMLNGYKTFLNFFMTHYVNQPRPGPYTIYTNPKTFRAMGKLAIPRNRLPATGTLRIWFPLPVVTDAQQSVTIDAITPATYLKVPPGGQDIGLAYMEVPLADLTGDLNVSITFSFTHHEQHYAVRSDLVGSYDTTDGDYIKYTRSYGNTTITPEIKETALKIINGETNPYLAAKKLYDYVVGQISYSLPPATLWPYGQPASVYVHQNRYGDCGCQSMYFAALCRSIGIPARATGGKQIFTGQYADHFWAEFYLPNYGWVPVDTSVAQMEYYIPDLSDEVRQAYREYFFGHQDNLRLIFQKDVDEPVFPALAGGMLYIPGAIQNPDGTCDTMDEHTVTGELIQKYWTLMESP